MSKEGGFGGLIGRTYRESRPWWPSPKRFEEGGPNVVIVLLDDTGFSHLGCYGSTIDTPQIDRLAAGGLRYTNFHTTALCSPTRASLLTGRNHHTVGMRAIANFDTGFPNMRGYITPHAATIAEILRDQGYATMAVGKWHLTPMIQASAAGPFEHWPLQRGFDRFYGFLQAETSQFYPELFYDNHPIDPPRGPESGYHLTEDLVDRSMDFIRNHRSVWAKKPFFLYLCTGATHAPHQAPGEFLEKYRGRFDAGWDAIREEWYRRQLDMGVVPNGTELAPRNPGVKPWSEIPENKQRFALRLQEAFAAFLDHTDHQIGRLVSFLEKQGELDNTLLILLSDNGASLEGGPSGMIDQYKPYNGIREDYHAIQARLDDIGGPNSHSNYPWGWSQAGNTPLRWYKSHIFGGGVRDPLIMHWPNGIKDRGDTRCQFHYVTDIMPTILDILSVDAPTTHRGYDQIPVSGTSMAYTFEGREEKTRKDIQYFEMFGRRGLWKDGWKAVTSHREGQPYSDREWDLYHLDEDFSECTNLAEDHPEKLREMIDLWWAEAGRRGVLPLDDRTVSLYGVQFRPGSPHAAREYTYYPPIDHLASDASPPFGNRSWTMIAEIERPARSDEGVIVAYGTQNAGFSWYIKDGRMIFDYNVFTDHQVVRSDRAVPEGECRIGVALAREGAQGTIALFIDGHECGTLQLPLVMRTITSTGMDVGRNSLSPITDDYQRPFVFTGKIKRLRIQLPRGNPSASRGEAWDWFRSEMSRQ
jgi:arylsulfatase